MEECQAGTAIVDVAHTSGNPVKGMGFAQSHGSLSVIIVTDSRCYS
jgi:hypothetical protein